jgi:hypothetical protein
MEFPGDERLRDLAQQTALTARFDRKRSLGSRHRASIATKGMYAVVPDDQSRPDVAPFGINFA